jgi:hypothetical protein
MSGQSFLTELYQGRLRWDLVTPYPEPSPAERRATETALGTLRRVCPTGSTVSRSSVDGLVRHGYTRAGLDGPMDGLGLSPWGIFQVVCQAVTACPPAGLLIAAENAFGLAALLPQLPPGPTYEAVRRRLAKGMISGLADTEPSGASNLERRTRLHPVADGYVLLGEKLYVSNAPVADALIVSATLSGRRRLVIVDTRSSGVHISPQEFMGLEGFPVGRVVLDGVRVPHESVVPGYGEPGSRITPEAVAMVRTGKTYFTAAPCLALCRQLLTWAARFVSSRRIDGRPLIGFEEIERRLAGAAADCFAMEALTDWALLTRHTVPGPDEWFERSATKNATTALAWRMSERLLPVLGAEGYETAASKAARASDRPYAAERVLRDVLAFRIAGGVDFQVDASFAQQFILRDGPPRSALRSRFGGPVRLREHAAFLARQVSAFGDLRRDLLAGGKRKGLHHRQSRLIRMNRLATELLTAALVLARASDREADKVRVYFAGCCQRMRDLSCRIRQDRSDRDSRAAKRVITEILERPCPE